MIAHSARRAGYSNFSNNYWAINPVPYHGRNACDQIGFCFQGCRSGAKWSTLYGEAPKAEATGHFELRAESMVLQVQHDPSGKVSGVLYADKDGNQNFQKARVVCVAGNAVESARLMLNSTSNTFPDGLANSSGQLGKNYVRHVTAFVYGVFDKPISWHRGTVGQTVLLDEWGHDEKRGFAGGYVMIGFSLGLPYYAAFMDPGAWGRAFTNKVETYNHVSGIAVTGEDMPLETNAVTLHPSERDQYGLPIPNLHMDDHENDIKLRNHGIKACTAMYQAGGAVATIDTPPMPGSHNMGTARMAANPRDGVVNGSGRQPVRLGRLDLRNGRRGQPDRDHRRTGHPPGRLHRRDHAQGRAVAAHRAPERKSPAEAGQSKFRLFSCPWRRPTSPSRTARSYRTRCCSLR